jgi:plastocyanin
MRRLTSLSVVTILLLVFLANNARTEEKKVVASIGTDGVQRVEVVGGSYFFDPNYVIVKVNVPVEMKIRKESGMVPHNFILKAPEAGMDVTVDLGKEPQTIRFTPTKVGEYPFYCDKKLLFFESHREKGMKGILKVEE